MPEGYKNFSKTKPMKVEHFDDVIKWWNNREEITIDEFPKAKRFTPKQLEELNYDLLQCDYPHTEEEILEPQELIAQFKQKREAYNTELENTLAKILELLNEDN